MTIKVAICAGHGYNTVGKRTPDDEREWDFNNIITVSFIKELSKYDNVEVKRLDDPTGKTDIPLTTRTNNAKMWGADVYISIHHNANTGKWGNWTGTETFRGNCANSIRLAKLVHAAQLKTYRLRDRGIKTASLHITRENNKNGIPSVLTEGGFMDSKIDIAKLRDNKVLENVGVEIAKAVAEYANLKLKTQSKTEIKGDDDKLILNNWQWDMLAQNLQKMYDEGTITSKDWVDKAQQRSLTISELCFLNNILITRKDK